MKKFVVIIIILVIIFIGMIVYKNMTIETNNISIQEIEKIENYINKIYIEKEIVGESLPSFEEINNANERWIWEVVKKNTEDDKITYEQLQESAKSIFGEEFTNEFPKEGTEYLIYNQEENMYQSIETEVDEQGALFLLNKIEKTGNGYEVEIIEYLEDYSPMLKEEPENYVIIRNLKEEEISRTNSSSEDEELDIVKRNIEKFSKKKVWIETKDNKLYVKKVEKEE